MKRCSKCKRLLNNSKFHRSSREKDGLRCWCKDCRRVEKASRDKSKDKEYYQQNRSEILKRTRIRRENDKRHVDQARQWRRRFRERNGLSYEALRTKTDTLFKLTTYLRSRLYKAVKRGSKNGSAIKDLGCSIQQFRSYLESKFQPGMTWNNYGQWHIDHIKPLSSFDLTDPEQFKQACHYTNLQPLWSVDNLRKSDSQTTTTLK